MLLPNPGGAPGFRCGDLFGFPGFPEMMQPMATTVLQEVLTRNAVATVAIETTLAVMEGDIALEIEAFTHDHPAARVGIYPVSGGGPPAVTLRLRVPEDDLATQAAFDALVERLRERYEG